MGTKELIKPIEKQASSSPKVRYFETKYTTLDFGKVLLHYNDLGCDPCREWTIKAIEDLNKSEIVTWIGETMELSKNEYDIKMSLPDDFTKLLN